MVKYVRFWILPLFILITSTVSFAATPDCPPGHEWDRRVVGCVQSGCRDIPHAFQNYVLNCVCYACGDRGCTGDPEFSKGCRRPQDYASCPGCLFMCINPEDACPGEGAVEQGTVTIQDEFKENPCIDPRYELTPEKIEKIKSMPGGVSIIDFVDGKVEIRRRGESEWSQAEAKTVLLPGDAIRTGPDSSTRLINKKILYKGDDAHVAEDIQRREISDMIQGNREFVERWGQTVGIIYGLYFDWRDYEVEEYKQDTFWIPKDTEICVGSDFLPEDEERGFIDVIKGGVRALTNGWRRNSIFSVKAGTTLCGIRGSEIIVTHDSATGKTGAYVLEGHMDVADTRTGEVRNLTDNQKVTYEKESLSEIQPMNRREWDNLVEESGVDFGIEDSDSTIQGDSPLPWLIGGGLLFLGGIGIIGVILAIVLLIIIVWLWRRRKKKKNND